MERRQVRRISLLSAALLMVLAPAAANAQTETTTTTPPPWAPLLLNPIEVAPGGEIKVATSASLCRGAGSVVTSPGFAAPIYFGSTLGAIEGRGRVITTPGSYTATLQCADPPATGQATFTILEPPRAFTLSPLEVRPGGDLTARIPAKNDCTGTTITSTGFTAPLELQPQGAELVGTAKAVTTPGVHDAVMECRDGPFTIAFTVVQDPPATQPQPIKKPKGAPETGGGGTA